MLILAHLRSVSSAKTECYLITARNNSYNFFRILMCSSPGPDLNNSPLGVLIWFRKDLVAIIADIHMFYGFLVKEDHRNYLRFLWYNDNDLSKEVVEYRMRVHVFENNPLSAVAIYSLRLAAQQVEQEDRTDTSHFVDRNFYVDISLMSFPTEAKAINLSQLNNTIWFTGPSFLYKLPQVQQREFFELVNPEMDAEVRPCETSFASLRRVLVLFYLEIFAISFLIHQTDFSHVKFHQHITYVQRMASV